MIIFLTITSVLLAIVIIGIVLLQQGKGSDLGSAFGGGSSNSMFGALVGGAALDGSSFAEIVSLFNGIKQ